MKTHFFLDDFAKLAQKTVNYLYHFFFFASFCTHIFHYHSCTLNVLKCFVFIAGSICFGSYGQREEERPVGGTLAGRNVQGHLLEVQLGLKLQTLRQKLETHAFSFEFVWSCGVNIIVTSHVTTNGKVE